jgi:hypothetical protein
MFFVTCIILPHSRSPGWHLSGNRKQINEKMISQIFLNEVIQLARKQCQFFDPYRESDIDWFLEDNFSKD